MGESLPESLDVCLQKYRWFSFGCRAESDHFLPKERISLGQDFFEIG